MRKNELSKSLIPIANGTWGAPAQLAQYGIDQDDVIKLRLILEGIVTEKRLRESPELDYFLAIGGSYETHHIFDNGLIRRTTIYLSPGVSSASPHQNVLPLRGVTYQYSPELQDLARSLINDLSEYDFLIRLRKCPYCEKFFIAKDTKRGKCYAKECFRASKKADKQRQRNDDPVKYV